MLKYILMIVVSLGFITPAVAQGNPGGNPDCRSRLLKNATYCEVGIYYSFIVGYTCHVFDATGGYEEETQCFQLNTQPVLGITTDFADSSPGTCACLANDSHFEMSADFLCRADTALWVQSWFVNGNGKKLRGQGFFGGYPPTPQISNCEWTWQAQSDCEARCDEE